MPRPVVSQSAEDLYTILSPIAFDDEALDWPLLNYCEAIAGALQEVNNYTYGLGYTQQYVNEELIPNGSFDDPLDYDVDRWWAHHSFHSTITRDTSVYNSAPASLKVSTTTGGTNLGASNENVPVRPNTEYTLEARIRNLTGQAFQYQINESALAFGGGIVLSHTSPTFYVSDDFTYVNFSFTTLPTSNYLNVFIIALGTVAVDFWIDDVRIFATVPKSDGYPNWSSVVDIDRVPYEAIPWLGQLVGVVTPPIQTGETEFQHEDRIREYVRGTPGFSRGTPDAIIQAAQQHLTGTKTVILRERNGGAYRLLVYTWDTETSEADWGGANLAPNGGFETNTSSWSLTDSSITRDTSQALFGSASGRVQSTSAANYDASTFGNVSGPTLGRVFTVSVYVKATGATIGDTFRLFCQETGGASGAANSSADVVLTSAWQRVSVTRTLTANDRTIIQLITRGLGSSGAGETFYLDGAQIEERLHVSPYIETNGAPVSRVGGLIEPALRSQKPGGIILTYDILVGQDYQLVFTNHPNYQDVFNDYSTYQGMFVATPGI